MIAALLLAAGASRRFGAPKLLQDLDGKPVVRWSAELLRGAPIDETLVVVGADGEGIRRALSGLDVRVVVNPRADLGMGSSLACAINACSAQTDVVLVSLADEPLLIRGALERVVGRYRAGGVSIVVPTYGGVRGHPVLFDRSVFDELRALSGDHGARAITDRDPSRVATIEIGEPEPIDVDTPADLARLRSSRRRGNSLIDEFMPTFDVSASYSTEVRAPADVVYRAVLETDLATSFLARTLMAIRSLGKGSTRSLRFGDFPSRGAFFALDRNPPNEIVVGVVGRFWALTRGTAVYEGDRASFSAPPAPGTAKAAWNFRVEETMTGSRLSTETRVLCADAGSLRQFRRYWALIGPFSGLLRKEALRLIREQAQFISSSNSRLS